MNQLLILVAGMPGAGKTRFADYLSAKMGIPLICKDRLKELMWNRLHYDTTVRSESRKFGGLAYDLAYHFCESLMQAGGPVIMESNFTGDSGEIIGRLAERYGYRTITVLFDGDAAVIHRRFLERDATEERHPGLVSNGVFSDLAFFEKQVQPCREFHFGDSVITVDATDFSKVSYDEIVEQILEVRSKMK